MKNTFVSVRLWVHVFHPTIIFSFGLHLFLVVIFVLLFAVVIILFLHSFVVGRHRSIFRLTIIDVGRADKLFFLIPYMFFLKISIIDYKMRHQTMLTLL